MCHHSRCSCGGGGLSRRELLGTVASASVISGFLMRQATAAEASAPLAGQEPPKDWPEVMVAFMKPEAKYWLGWPGTSFDVDGYMNKCRALVEKFGKDLKVRVRFEAKPLFDQAAVDGFIAKAKTAKPQGVILFPVHMDRWGMIEKIAKEITPCIIFAPLGVCFTQHIQTISRYPGVYLASTSDFELGPVRFGMKMIRTNHDVRRSRIAILQGDQKKDEILEPFGLQIRRLPRQLFPDTLKTVGETPDVISVADEYEKAAQKIVEPSRQDIIHAAKNYVTSCKILKEHQCNGISMDCLGLVMDRKIPTPPCMAWSKFLDVGTPAICEADVNAVMSTALCCKLLDKPGFIQDPVPDTVNNTFIGAHCVCASRMNGFDKPREPFVLRSHSESDIGVSLQVLFKIDQPITIMQFSGPGKLLLGKGKVVRNLDTPPAGGCRTSVELAIDGPADTRDTKGFHQLFIYGDHVRDFQAYGQLYGIATEHI